MKKLNLSLGLGSILVAGFLLAGSAQAGGIFAGIGSSVPDSKLARATVKNILLGNQQYWSNNQRIVVFIGNQGSAERKAVLKEVGMTESAFSKHWIGKVFRGEAREPKVFSSLAEATSAAANEAGAILFGASKSVHKKLKKVTIK